MSNVNVQAQRDFDQPLERVWARLADFGDISWTVGTERVEVVGSGPGMTRRIFMPGLEQPIEEVLESIDHAAHSFSYTIPRGFPMPIGNYLAQVRLEALPSGGCRVRWSGSGEALGVGTEQASQILEGVYAQMLGWLADALAGN